MPCVYTYSSFLVYFRFNKIPIFTNCKCTLRIHCFSQVWPRIGLGSWVYSFLPKGWTDSTPAMHWSILRGIWFFLGFQYTRIWLHGSWVIGFHMSAFESYIYQRMLYLDPADNCFAPSIMQHKTSSEVFKNFPRPGARKCFTLWSDVPKSSELANLRPVPPPPCLKCGGV